MKSKILIIHPCFGRAGTTSFQEILRNLNVNILAKPCEKQQNTTWFKLFKSHLPEHSIALFDQLYVSKNPKPYNYHTLRQNFKDYLEDFFSNQNTVSVFSDEGILGPMTKGSFSFKNLHIFNEIIKEVENDLNIKIIIKLVFTIRKQYNCITSSYYYMEKFHKTMSIEEFNEKIIKLKDYRNIFDYTFTIKKIIKIFNSEVLILPLELLENDQKKYIHQFCNFINLDISKIKISEKIHENKNYDLKDSVKNYYFNYTVYNRTIYSLFSIIHNKLKKIDIYNKNFRNNVLLKFIYQIVKPKTKKILAKNSSDKLLENKIKSIFKESNLELERLTNVKLQDFDYY